MRRSALVTCLLLLGMLVSSSTRAGDARTSAAIWQSLNGEADLVALYAQDDAAPLWLDPQGALLLPGMDALRLLAFAADEGLDTADYDVDGLRALAQASATTHEPEAIAHADVALSRALLRYLRDLHIGRVDPRAAGFVLDLPRHGHDFAHLLHDATDRRQIVDTARVWSPRGPQYPALRGALGRYRALAATEAPVSLPFTKSVHPGERYPALVPLVARLRWLGDVDDAAPEPAGEVYDGAVVEAVRRFQRRHGLTVDGVLGTHTLAALEVPMARRVRQLELAMERLRWLPHEAESRLVLVNIPMFRLFAWDSIPPAGAPSFSTGVIVGRALRTRTPVFAADLVEILYRPFWNVPTSILRTEVLPRLATDPGYLQREQMELVAGQGDQSPVVPPTPENLAQLRTGSVRLRQRPGPKNSLGLIKFSFPNEHDVYMHGTPAPALFARSRRDFSHGCVRVADPLGLAEWVLRGQPEWDREHIASAMQADVSSRVIVRVPVRVMLLYSTAAVLLESGAVAFADDIYGLDVRLDRALRER